MGRLENKVAIITGAAGGIGKETAKAFLKEGAKVTLVDLDEEKLEEIKEDLSSFGELLVVPADVSKEDQVKNYVDKTVEVFGQVDVFFNNAGVTGDRTPLVDIELEDFDNLMAINVRGVFLGMKYVLPIMIEQERGSIINTSSVDGLRGSPELSPYSASKHAVVGLTKSAALEVAEKSVRVNSIHPSPVDTEMMTGLEDGEGQDQFLEQIPLDRYADAEELASLVLFLASDDSEFITGAQYRIDGGMGAQQ